MGLNWACRPCKAEFSAHFGNNIISHPNRATMTVESIVTIYTLHAKIIHFNEKRITVSKWHCWALSVSRHCKVGHSQHDYAIFCYVHYPHGKNKTRFCKELSKARLAFLTKAGHCSVDAILCLQKKKKIICTEIKAVTVKPDTLLHDLLEAGICISL